MEFESKKFNFIIISILVLICVVIVFCSVDIKTNDNEQMGQIDADNNFDNSEENNDNMQGESEDIGMPELPGQLNGKSQLIYALDLLNKYNYKVDITQSIYGESGGFGGTQQLKFSSYYIDNIYYGKIVADGSDIPLGKGETYTMYYKYDDNYITINKNNSLNTGMINDYLNYNGVMPGQIPYNFDKITTSVLNDPNASYYEISLTLNSSNWDNYLRYLSANGGTGSNPKINSINLTLKINKKYGYIISISCMEKYEISRSGFRASTTATINYKFTYGNNFEQEINDIKGKLN